MPNPTQEEVRLLTTTKRLEAYEVACAEINMDTPRYFLVDQMNERVCLVILSRTAVIVSHLPHTLPIMKVRLHLHKNLTQHFTEDVKAFFTYPSIDGKVVLPEDTKIIRDIMAGFRIEPQCFTYNPKVTDADGLAVIVDILDGKVFMQQNGSVKTLMRHKDWRIPPVIARAIETGIKPEDGSLGTSVARGKYSTTRSTTKSTNIVTRMAKVKEPEEKGKESVVD